jgi:hypothetical protein
LVRALVVVLLDEGIEARLLLQQIRHRRGFHITSVSVSSTPVVSVSIVFVSDQSPAVVPHVSEPRSLRDDRRRLHLDSPSAYNYAWTR